MTERKSAALKKKLRDLSKNVRSQNTKNFQSKNESKIERNLSHNVAQFFFSLARKKLILVLDCIKKSKIQD